MNKAEVINLIDYLVQIYPNNKVTNVAKLANAWSDVFEPYNPEDVMEAARCISRSRAFFPAASEIIERIIPAQYEKLGIPEVRPTEDELANMNREERQVAEVKARYTRPFTPPKPVKLTDQDIQTLEEFLDLPYEL